MFWGQKGVFKTEDFPDGYSVWGDGGGGGWSCQCLATNLLSRLAAAGQVWPLPVHQSVGERPGANTVTVMGFCSAVTLAFATIFSLVAAALLAIAFSTDNWITINVNRNQLRNKVSLSLCLPLSRYPLPAL